MKFFSYSYSDYDAQFTPKILLVYYLLSYETKRRETLLQVSASIQNTQNQTTYTKTHLANLDALFSFCYSSEIFDHVPINYLLVKAKQQDFLVIYPSLLRLVLNLFSQLCQVEHCLFEPRFESISESLSLEHLIRKFEAIKICIGNNELTRNQAHMFKRQWLQAYSIHGRKLSLKTMSAIFNLPKLKYEDIYSNPLVLLKCEDLKIYKSGPIFEIILYIIKECLLANKNQMENFVIETHMLVVGEVKANQFNIVKTLKERQELKNSLLSIQDTGVIQVLLDLILIMKSKYNEFITREIQCLICSFIHQMFIENTNLAELVHFQGYPKKLQPILVQGVPSMHICLDFVPKLLSHSDINKQIFAINLIAQLCRKYPIVKTYNGVKLAINVANTLLQSE